MDSEVGWTLAKLLGLKGSDQQHKVQQEISH